MNIYSDKFKSEAVDLAQRLIIKAYGRHQQLDVNYIEEQVLANSRDVIIDFMRDGEGRDEWRQVTLDNLTVEQIFDMDQGVVDITEVIDGMLVEYFMSDLATVRAYVEDFVGETAEAAAGVHMTDEEEHRHFDNLCDR